MNQEDLEEEAKRKETYDTIPRAVSEVSLRETKGVQAEGDASKSKPQRLGSPRTSLTELREDQEQDQGAQSKAVEKARHGKDEGQPMQKKQKQPGSSSHSFKRNSMVTLGMVKGSHPTQFDEEDDGLGTF